MTHTTDTPQSWMIYGVNGYTGRLCAEEARKRGMQPIAAGRNEDHVSRVARELDLPYRVFDLADTAAAVAGLQDVAVVLNCAGPFSATARPFLDACVTTKTHYLDVTGEIAVFEYVHKNTDRWKQAGITALPGVGFDVVPTDCMAAMLKEALPGAVRLRLAFKSKHGKLSPGTTKTLIEGFRGGYTIRRDGKLAPVPLGAMSCVIPYADKPVLSVLIAWGDVSTAFHSTGIPNIEVYTVMPESQLRRLPTLNRMARVLRWKSTQYLLKRLVEWKVTGPSESERNRDASELYGDATDADGHSVSMTMQTPNGYTLTYHAAVTSVERVLSGAVALGAQTPSRAFGSDFVLTLPGVKHMPPA